MTEPTASPGYAAELVDGIDDGFAAWLIYAPDGSRYAGPVGSDLDMQAMLADLNG